MELAFERSRRLDPKLKLLAELKAATLAACEWCIDFGSMLSHREGITEEQLRDLPRYRDSDAFSELEKLVLDYATAMSRTPVEVSEELFEALRRHLDEPQLVELSTAVALENYRARFNRALEIEPQGFSEGAFCAIPERGATGR
jgi:AhpD family alkylhydroperoxidase